MEPQDQNPHLTADWNELMASSNPVFLLPSTVSKCFLKAHLRLHPDTMSCRSLRLRRREMTCRKCWRRQRYALAISGKKSRGLASHLCFGCWLTSLWLSTDWFSLHFCLNLLQGRGKMCWAGRHKTSTIVLNMISAIYFLKALCFNLGSQLACSLLLRVNTLVFPRVFISRDHENLVTLSLERERSA